MFILQFYLLDKWKFSRSNHKEVFNAMQIFFQTVAAEPFTQVIFTELKIDLNMIFIFEIFYLILG
jgi:hypothetical protein